MPLPVASEHLLERRQICGTFPHHQLDSECCHDVDHRFHSRSRRAVLDCGDRRLAHDSLGGQFRLRELLLLTLLPDRVAQLRGCAHNLLHALETGPDGASVVTARAYISIIYAMACSCGELSCSASLRRSEPLTRLTCRNEEDRPLGSRISSPQAKVRSPTLVKRCAKENTLSGIRQFYTPLRVTHGP